MWQVYLSIGVAVIAVSVLWANGIANMHKNHPDYKGEDFLGGFDFDDKEVEDVLWGENVEVIDDEEIKPTKKIKKNIEKD